MDSKQQKLQNEARGSGTGDSQPQKDTTSVHPPSVIVAESSRYLETGSPAEISLDGEPFTSFKSSTGSRANTVTSAGNSPRLVAEHLGSFIGNDQDDLSLRSSLKVYESDTSPESSPLDDALRDATLDSIEKDGRQFIPISEQAKIISRNSVYDELKRLRVGHENRISSLADQVWGTPSSPEEDTRRKIFAILVLTEKVKSIVRIVEEGVYDRDLPFVFSRARAESKVFRNGGGDAISLFRKWKATEKDSFERYQWLMMSPYFQLSCERLPLVNRYSVWDRAVLPYIAETSILEQPPWNEGGFSEVRRVKFQLSHYNWTDFCTSEKDAPAFAIKKIKCPADGDALQDSEVEALVRLNKENHNHLIRLLGAFQYRRRLHLVFPWADGNLQDFWKKSYPVPDDPPRDCRLARWMVKQCLGLAQGIRKIHNNLLTDSEAKAQSLKPDTPHKRHGRHGDLKPENILWFRPPTDALGVLRISDFGFADFYGTNSKSKMEKRGMTGTYRAPEWDMKDYVAPEYDIWCMGCILLEFVEWYLCGAKGIDDFISKRIDDSHNELPHYTEDNFFNRIKMELDERRAMAKKSVREELALLRAHERCSDFLLDLLNYIEDHMLRMGPQKRASCDDLVHRLQEIYEQCRESTTYCTLKTKTVPQKRETELSELVVQLLSPKNRQHHFGTPIQKQTVENVKRADSEQLSSADNGHNQLSHHDSAENRSNSVTGLGLTMEPQDVPSGSPEQQTVAKQINREAGTDQRASGPEINSGNPLEGPPSTTHSPRAESTDTVPPQTLGQDRSPTDSTYFTNRSPNPSESTSRTQNPPPRRKVRDTSLLNNNTNSHTNQFLSWRVFKKCANWMRNLFWSCLNKCKGWTYSRMRE